MKKGTVDLAAFGLTEEELAAKVVERIAARLMGEEEADEEGRHGTTGSFMRAVNTAIVSAIEKRVACIAETHVLPRVKELVEGVCLVETNRWGERTGRKLTFIEYLVDRAEKWITEEVNYDGKSQADVRNSGSSFTARSTRIAHMVNKHLHYEVEAAMKRAFETANATIKGGLEAAMKTCLDNVAKGLIVKVDVKAP